MIEIFKNIGESRIAKLYCKIIIFSEQYLFSALLLAMRIWMANIFWKSGLTKISNFNTTIALFKYEYNVPIFSPKLAALLATFNELTMPLLLVVGLFSRVPALALLVMTVVIEFTYLNFREHFYWAFLLSTILFYGPGRFSLDYFISKKIYKK